MGRLEVSNYMRNEMKSKIMRVDEIGNFLNNLDFNSDKVATKRTPIPMKMNLKRMK